MGQDASSAAAKAFRLLTSADMRQPARQPPAERRTAHPTPAAPLDLDLVDYITAHVQQIVTHTRAIADNPTLPTPRRPDDLYDWYIDHTAEATEDQQNLRDLLIERHRLEHAIRLGDYDQVCREPCPRCGCWGLMWEGAAQRALCSNRRCRTPDGYASRWPLARLAAQKVHRTEIWRRNAT